MQAEARILKHARELLQANGWHVRKFHGGKFDSKGTPDLLAIKRGLHVWIEVKTPQGALTPLQEIEHRRMQEAGAYVVVAHSGLEALTLAEDAMHWHSRPTGRKPRGVSSGAILRGD